MTGLLSPLPRVKSRPGPQKLLSSGEFLDRVPKTFCKQKHPGISEVPFERRWRVKVVKARGPPAIGGPLARNYIFFRVALMLLRRFAAAVFLRVMLGGSKCCRRRASEMIDSCCTRLVKRRRNPSKLSPSLILISTNSFPDSRCDRVLSAADRGYIRVTDAPPSSIGSRHAAGQCELDRHVVFLHRLSGEGELVSHASQAGT